MASVTTSEFVKTRTRQEATPFSLLEHKSLVARLTEELSRAATDFARDPRVFIRELFTDENKDLKRRRLIYAGLGCALIAHFVFLAVIFIADWNKPAEKTDPEVDITWVPPSNTLKSTEPKIDVPIGDAGSGRGGSGQNQLLKASHGAAPQSLPSPPIVKPDAPKLPNPVLAINPNIQGPESIPPPADATIGVPTASLDAPPSPGTGKGGGIGDGEGDGLGGGKGSGLDKGQGGGKNGGQLGSPNGTAGLEQVPFSRISSLPKEIGFTQFRWLYRASPVVTPEARDNKIAGTVLLRATLRSDGFISDIEVVSPVQFMTESAIESLKRCRFRPATINGKPVTLTRVPIKVEVHY